MDASVRRIPSPPLTLFCLLPPPSLTVCLEPENNGGPSPASSDMTNSPAVEIVDFATVSPGATVEVEDVFDREYSPPAPRGFVLACTVPARENSP